VIQPPGHVPGYHAPGTTVPIGHIVEQQRRQQVERNSADPALGAAELERAERRNLLLLLDE
jgi:hypothetical protein